MTRPLGELRSVERADVYKAGVRAATLERESDCVVFAYTHEYLQGNQPPVAFTLPRGQDPVRSHTGGALPPFFAGLLPEGRRLGALRRAVKTSADDELSLLLAVGSDLIGDVRVVPEGESPQSVEPALIVDRWDAVRFANLISSNRGAGVDRVGLPGVQDKASARMISLPVAQQGARYLLKLDPPEYPHLITNEQFFLDAARRCGIEAASAEIVHDQDGLAGLLVRRFDRVSTATGEVRSLAQEDACQVLGRYPADKYRLTTEEVVGALAQVCQARPVAARALFRQFVFAYLTCNGDAHAKNFSVLFDSEWRVAPAYDLPSSHPYGDHTLALSIGGKSHEDVGRDDFGKLAAVVGLGDRAAQSAIDSIIDKSEAWIGELNRLPFAPRQLHKLRRAIEHRRERLRRGG